jgi:putative heme-binding domain-containing protein
LLAQAASIVGVRRRLPELAALVTLIGNRLHQTPPSSTSPDRSSSEMDALAMLAGLAAGLERSGPALHALIAAPPEELKTPLSDLGRLTTFAASLVVSNRPAGERIIALDVLAAGWPAEAEGVIPKLLSVHEPTEIQASAVRAMARADRPALVKRVISLWGDLGLATRREVLTALVGSALLAKELVAALEGQEIVPAELDAATREALLHLTDPGLRARAAAVLARFAPPERSRVVAKYRGALDMQGDLTRGEALFSRTCQSCHQHQGRGYRAGPDLSGVAGRAPEALLSDILDPNREVAPDYTTLAVATRSGQVVTGLLVEETATTLKLRRSLGVEETVLRSEIDQVRSTGQSLMPEGLEHGLSLHDMADLIAFLRQGSNR